MEVTKYLLIGMILQVKRNHVGKDTPIFVGSRLENILKLLKEDWETTISFWGAMDSYKEGTQNDVKGRWKGSTRHCQNLAQSKPIVYCLWRLCHVHTVDGNNPARPGMYKTHFDDMGYKLPNSTGFLHF